VPRVPVAPMSPAEEPRVSVVCTVLNERKGIRDLLDSLVTQRPAHEVIMVDAGSTDGTWGILMEYAAAFPQVRPVHYAGKRGAGRNMGVRLARSSRVAFIDGDCIANPFWLDGIVAAMDAGAKVVAGRTIMMGYWAFTKMHRVELPHRGQDITWPSCNLAYDRELFLSIGGFDERFVTAEDIDLNFRAVDVGHKIAHVRGSVVYAQARDSVRGFLRQAYWNGYGRKQLTLKHGRLWGEYSFRDMLKRQFGLWASLRLGAATLGYLKCKLREEARLYRDAAGGPATMSPALTAPLPTPEPRATHQGTARQAMFSTR
jgi:glycosyltransferase involved in cell wall biosynthesis